MPYDRLIDLANRKRWSDVEKDWMDVIERIDVDPARLLPIIDLAVKLGQAELAATMGWAWLSTMKEKHSPREALQLGRGLLLRLPDGDQLREEILELYVQTHDDRKDLDWWVSRSGLQSGKSVRRALRFLDTGLKLTPGTALFHRTEEEAARILEADFEGDEVEIKTARRSRVLSVEEVIDNYDVVDDNDFRVLNQLDRERISELAKKNPAELVIGILRAHGSQVDRDALKLMLVPSHIAAGDWSSWWTRVRTAVKKSPHLRIEGRSPMMLIYEELGRTLEQDTKAALDDAKGPRGWLEVLEEYLRNTKHRKVKPDPTFLDRVQSFLAGRITLQLKHKEAGAAFATALVIERVAADGLPISTDAHGMALRMLQEAPDPISLVGSLPDNRLWSLGIKCVEQVFADDWPEHVAKLVLCAPGSLIDGLVGSTEKAGRGDLLPAIVLQGVANPGRHTDMLMWLWKGPETKTDLPIPSLLELFNMTMALVGPARLSEGKVAGQSQNEMRAKIRAGLSHKSYARFRECIKQQSDAMAPAIRRQIERADGLGNTVRDEMLKILRGRFPHMYVQKKVDMWRDESVVYFTESGLRSKQTEIDELINVKMRENAKAIGEAASRGDLSENSEYKFAIEERDLLRARLAQLNSEVEGAKVLSPADVPEDHVSIGQRVTLKPCNGGSSVVLTMLGAGESDVNARAYSYQTPLAQSVMGHRLGEKLTLSLDGSQGEYEVERIENALA